MRLGSVVRFAGLLWFVGFFMIWEGSMSPLVIILLLLIVFGFGGGLWAGPAYGPYGYGFGGILLVILLILFLTGRL